MKKCKYGVQSLKQKHTNKVVQIHTNVHQNKIATNCGATVLIIHNKVVIVRVH